MEEGISSDIPSYIVMKIHGRAEGRSADNEKMSRTEQRGEKLSIEDVWKGNVEICYKEWFE